MKLYLDYINMWMEIIVIYVVVNNVKDDRHQLFQIISSPLIALSRVSTISRFSDGNLNGKEQYMNFVAFLFWLLFISTIYCKQILVLTFLKLQYNYNTL